MNKFLPISISFLFFIFIMSKSWGLPLCPKKTKFSLNRDLCYGYFHYQKGYKSKTRINSWMTKTCMKKNGSSKKLVNALVKMAVTERSMSW